MNNGGLAQYLLNQGRRRARRALAALGGISARRTAALLVLRHLDARRAC